MRSSSTATMTVVCELPPAGHWLRVASVGSLLAALAAQASGCARVGFAMGDGTADRALEQGHGSDGPRGDRRTAADLGMQETLVTVCASGCDFTDLPPAIAYLASLQPPSGERLAIEVRDSLTYPHDAKNLLVPPLASSGALELRAAKDARPRIAGPIAGTNSTALSVAAPNVTVAGFLFLGKTQRAIQVSAPRVTIHHNTFSSDFNAWSPDQFFRGTGVLLIGEGTNGAYLYNNTFHDCQEALQVLDAPVPGNTVRLRNNIFVQLTEGRSDYEPILWLKPSREHYNLDSDYNLFFFTGAECIAWSGTAPIVSLPAWQETGLDPHGIGTSVDPLLFNPPKYDYHPRSQGGRFDPAASQFVVDAEHSSVIDAGDPAFPVGLETAPNGGRINLGRFGGTSEASRSRN